MAIKKLFQTIFDLRSSIVLTFSIAVYPVGYKIKKKLFKNYKSQIKKFSRIKTPENFIIGKINITKFCYCMAISSGPGLEAEIFA